MESGFSGRVWKHLRNRLCETRSPQSKFWIKTVRVEYSAWPCQRQWKADLGGVGICVGFEVTGEKVRGASFCHMSDSRRRLRLDGESRASVRCLKGQEKSSRDTFVFSQLHHPKVNSTHKLFFFSVHTCMHLHTNAHRHTQWYKGSPVRSDPPSWGCPLLVGLAR